MATIVSVDYLRAENLKGSTRAKHGLPSKGYVKAVVTRNSPAITSYEKVDMISELRETFANLKGKKL